jgi:hypothetical protein
VIKIIKLYAKSWQFSFKKHDKKCDPFAFQVKILLLNRLFLPIFKIQELR